MEYELSLTIQGKYLRDKIEFAPYDLCIVGFIRDKNKRYPFQWDCFMEGKHFLVTPDVIFVFTPEGEVYIGLSMNLTEFSSRVSQCIPLTMDELQEGVCYCADTDTAEQFYNECLDRYFPVDVDYKPDSSLAYRIMDDIYTLASTLSSYMNPVELRETWSLIELAEERFAEDRFYGMGDYGLPYYLEQEKLGNAKEDVVTALDSAVLDYLRIG